MCAAKHSKTTSAGGDHSSADITGEDSSHFLNILGKRSTSDNSVEKLRQEVDDDDSHDSNDDSGTGDDGDKRERR
jgi:hypothetical protein